MFGAHKNGGVKAILAGAPPQSGPLDPETKKKLLDLLGRLLNIAEAVSYLEQRSEVHGIRLKGQHEVADVLDFIHGDVDTNIFIERARRLGWKP